MRKKCISVLIVIFVIIFILFVSELVTAGFGLWSQFNRNVETTLFIQKYRSELVHILTNEFDKASTCQTLQCRDEVSLQIFNSLDDIEKLVLFPAMVFVRANDNQTIEVMTLSGRYNLISFNDLILHHHGSTNVTDLKKKRQTLYKVLKGNLPNIFIQYGYKMDSTTTTMRYLGYIHSEAEIIHIVRNNSGEIVGGIVRFHGD